MDDIVIRNEMPADRQITEELTRRAFYNMYVPGCVEHYLLHIMREHEDFIPELDLVAEFDEGLPKLEKSWQPSQEEFYILSNAFLE